MTELELIYSPIEPSFIEIIESVRDFLFIATPYIKDYGVKTVINHMVPSHINLLTNLEISNITSSNVDISAILKLWDINDVHISSLGKLHAKVYIADGETALVTSANLTRGGLCDNYEYGIILRDKKVVHDLQVDMSLYFELGNQMDKLFLERVRKDVKELQILQKTLDDSIEIHLLRKKIAEKTDNLQEKILTNRLKEGKTINSIFSQTIIYLLKKWGPLSTLEIHPLIQQIHPDICDDHIDRIINGQHFGKKWKHLVRDAQQYLKYNKSIVLSNGKWMLLQ